MQETRKSVAIVGGGVAGLTAAWLLQHKAQVDLYERNDYAGGHTRTIEIDRGPDAGTPVDMGFIVMNHKNYPLLTRLLERLDVALGDSDMSFGYSCRATGYAYSGSSIGGLFANPANLLSADHWRMLGDIVSFSRNASRELEAGEVNGDSLGRYVERGGYSRAFRDHYLVAMGSAIWSAPMADVLEFPAQPYLQFFHNHGLLSFKDRPQWRFVRGGSQTYVRAMAKTLEHAIHLREPVTEIHRNAQGVEIGTANGRKRCYDAVILATHADEAIALLQDASGEEARLLGAWSYRTNQTVLHTDASVMPRARKAWASWNFLRQERATGSAPVAITYHMNRLQRLDTHSPYFVSLNLERQPTADSILHSEVFTHPTYTFESLATQDAIRALNGKANTYFCGSYMGHGFHEDAVRSACDVAEMFGVSL